MRVQHSVAMRTSVRLARLRSRCSVAVARSPAGRLSGASRITLPLSVVSLTVVPAASGGSRGIAFTVFTTSISLSPAVVLVPSIAALVSPFVVATTIPSIVIAAFLAVTTAFVAGAVVVPAVIVSLITALAIVVTARTASASAVASAPTIFEAAPRTGVFAGVSINHAWKDDGRGGRRLLTSLRWPKVLAGGGSARSSATRLFNAQGATLDLLALKALLSSLSLFGSDHLNEAKSTGLLGVRVTHDLALLNVAILLKHLGNLGFGQARMDASDKEVGAWVDGPVIVPGARVLVATGRGKSDRLAKLQSRKHMWRVERRLTHQHCRWGRRIGGGHHHCRRGWGEEKRFDCHAHTAVPHLML